MIRGSSEALRPSADAHQSPQAMSTSSRVALARAACLLGCVLVAGGLSLKNTGTQVPFPAAFCSLQRRCLMPPSVQRRPDTLSRRDALVNGVAKGAALAGLLQTKRYVSHCVES
eukprot:scaffold2923_cov313-Pinguiococcus_pyrenoidosus.AAC.21